MKSKERNFGIDLLRIVSMYMIVILHVLGQGGILNNLEVLSLKYNLAWLLEITCYCAVNCYALITGYVMINSKFKYKKIITLWTEVVFWAVLLTIIMNIKYPILVGKKDLLYSFFPIIFNKYWYFSSYFCLFFFIPFINKLIDILDKNNFKRLIITMIILFSILNLVSDPFKLSDGYSFLWLVTCYFIGAYINKYKSLNTTKNKYLLIGIIISIAFTLSFKLLILKYPNITFGLFGPDLFIKYNSITILIISIFLLIIFTRLKITNKYLKRFIKRISPATFGVYIIHVHPKIWTIIMSQRFKFLITYEPIMMILLVLLSAFIVYMLCSYMEMLRIYIFKKIKIQKLIDCLYEHLEKIINHLKSLTNFKYF